MKKLLLVVLAAVGLASCVQTEELAVANNNTAIAFDTFVDNVTKTIYDNANLDHFNVYGTITSDNNTVKTNIFPGVEVEKGANGWAYDSNYTQYWIPGFTYNFTAVVDGDVDVDATYGMPVTISTDMANQEDILYATVERHFGANDTAAKVSFQFAHLLSKAKFTVKNSIAAGSDFVYNIASIKVTNADKNAEYNIGAGVWTVDGTYTADFGVDDAVAQLGQVTGADVLLVPGTKELAIEVVYNLTYKGTELKAETKNLTAALTLEQGKAYNFIVEFGKPGEDIAFDAEVEDWVENDVQTPSVLVTTAAELKAALSNPSVAGAILGNDITLSETISRAEAESGATISKSFVLDGNGKTLTYTGQNRAIDIVSDVENENETYKNVTIKDLTINCSAGYCQRGINYNANGTLVLDNVKVGGQGVTYALNFPGMSDNAQVTINNCEATGCIALNLWGENMVINVNNSILTSVDTASHENYSAVNLNNDGEMMANGTVVNIKGGKVIARDENGDPSYAVKNSSLTGNVIIDETTEVVGKIAQNVAIVYFDGANEFYGSVSLAAAVETYFENANASGIRLLRNIELDAPLTIPAGKPVVLDLNGKTLSGVDTTTANFGLVNISTGADLTVQGGGKLQLSATNNRNWGSYSSVISNQRGTLLVKGGVVIEHLGGTAMAYGIDNLTNGKGTVAVTTIEDATVKSPYRAIRQFLNGTEARNELYVKAGAVIETTGNKAIWMQSPNANANSGKLVVEAGAQLKNNVYVDAPAAMDIEISVAKSALVNGAAIDIELPAGYMLVEENGVWAVIEATSVSNAAELESALKAGGNILLANDIALSAPIQIDGKTFSLNGNGHKIGQDSAYPLEGTTTTALLHPIGCTATIENVLFDGLKGDGPIRTVDTKLALNNVTVTNCERTATGSTAQGLFRLHGESTVTNCTLKNNVCPMGISLNWDGNNDLPQAVIGCVFEKNTCHATAVVYYVKGAGATINGNKFVDNTVTVTGGSNAATLYMGFTENNVITNNLFKNNTVNAGTSKRVSGGLMIGYAATITGNAFVGNIINAENENLGNDVCASVYYTDINLSGNYWGGNAPVANDDYFVEYPDRHVVIINDHLTTNPLQ